MKTVKVLTGAPYEVKIGRGLLARTGQELAALTQSRHAAVICDDTVHALYAERVAQSLKDAGFQTEGMRFQHGEASKNLHTYAMMLEWLAENHFTRSDVVIALGGGVTGDMAGFAAATYLRGIDVYQIPTTLLAMVDSSVGGKTGVDLAAGKNLVGAFHQPIGVLCDPDTLATLPSETFADGVAEAIKYGVIGSEPLFDALATGKADVETVIEQCVQMKADICAEDETEQGRRKLLNLGHTLGHAVEKCSHYEISHGHAVAIGMVYATRMACRIGLCEENTLQALLAALEANHLPTSAPFDASMLAEVALSDKKRAGDRMTLILPKKIGECVLHSVAVNDLKKLAEMAL